MYLALDFIRPHAPMPPPPLLVLFSNTTPPAAALLIEVSALQDHAVNN